MRIVPIEVAGENHEGGERMRDEKRVFTLQGCKHRLTLTELRSRLDGTPTKHVLAVWDDGERTRA